MKRQNARAMTVVGPPWGSGHELERRVQELRQCYEMLRAIGSPDIDLLVVCELGTDAHVAVPRHGYRAVVGEVELANLMDGRCGVLAPLLSVSHAAEVQFVPPWYLLDLEEIASVIGEGALHEAIASGMYGTADDAAALLDAMIAAWSARE